jgi:hypothetical protein
MERANLKYHQTLSQAAALLPPVENPLMANAGLKF